MFDNFKPSIILLSSLIIVGTLLNGCSSSKNVIKRTQPEEGEDYTTQFAMSGIEYELFITKEIGVVENLLVTRMMGAMNIKNKKGATNNEINNVTEDLSKLEDIIEDVTFTMPAKDYESDTSNLLLLLNESKDALETYKTALENGSDMSDSIQKLQACYLALGGEANSYYE